MKTKKLRRLLALVAVVAMLVSIAPMVYASNYTEVTSEPITIAAEGATNIEAEEAYPYLRYSNYKYVVSVDGASGGKMFAASYWDEGKDYARRGWLQ